MTSVFFISLIAIVVGFLGSLPRLGGGIVMAPAPTLLFHVDIRYAIGVSIISVITMSSGVAITYLEDHLTNTYIGMFLEIGITLGAITGASLSGAVNTRYLYPILGLLMLYFAVMMFHKVGSGLPRDVVTYPAAERLRLNSPYYDKSLDQGVPYQVAGVYGDLGMMYVASMTSSLLGVGDGTFKVMRMDLFIELPIRVSNATSNFMTGVTAAASTGAYFFRGDINPGVVAPVALGILIGTVVGTRVIQRMKSQVIQPVFVPVLVVISVRMIVEEVLMG